MKPFVLILYVFFSQSLTAQPLSSKAEGDGFFQQAKELFTSGNKDPASQSDILAAHGKQFNCYELFGMWFGTSSTHSTREYRWKSTISVRSVKDELFDDQLVVTRVCHPENKNFFSLKTLSGTLGYEFLKKPDYKESIEFTGLFWKLSSDGREYLVEKSNEIKKKIGYYSTGSFTTEKYQISEIRRESYCILKK